MFRNTASFSSEIGITERDKEIRKRFYNPETVAIAADLFSSRQTMYRRLNKLCEMGLLYAVGNFPTGNGRWPIVFSTWKVSKTKASHEVLLSRVLRSWKLNLLRGPDVGPLLPDAELGRLCVEMDCDTEGWPFVMKKRLSGYLDMEKVVVFVTTNEIRRTGVLERCDFLSECLLACTIEEALRGEAWDTDGKKWVLKKVFEKVLPKV